MMGGRIWARSRPGGGAEFGFSLPAYAEEDEDAFEGPRIRQVDQVPPVAATA
jgi:hypothetical protein